MSAKTDDPGDHGPDPVVDPVIAEASIAEAALAESTESHRPATEADLYLYRQEYYDRYRRARRTDMQLGFLFALTFIAFLVLAFRVESNDAKLSDGLHAACLARVAAVQQGNVGRESLVQAVVTGPSAPQDPVARAALAKQLRDALLLPIEDCGPFPP
jgi:hypothetical protein